MIIVTRMRAVQFDGSQCPPDTSGLAASVSFSGASSNVTGRYPKMKARFDTIRQAYSVMAKLGLFHVRFCNICMFLYAQDS